MSQICELGSTQPRTIHCILIYLIALHHASIMHQSGHKCTQVDWWPCFHRDPLLNLTQVDNILPVHYHGRSGRSSCAPCVLRKLHCLWQSNFFKAIGRLRVAAIHVFQIPVVLTWRPQSLCSNASHQCALARCMEDLKATKSMFEEFTTNVNATGR